MSQQLIKLSEYSQKILQKESIININRNSTDSAISGFVEAPEPQSGAPTPEKLNIVNQESFATPSRFDSP